MKIIDRLKYAKLGNLENMLIAGGGEPLFYRLPNVLVSILVFALVVLFCSLGDCLIVWLRSGSC